MSAENYNRRQFEDGLITGKHLVQLTECWQKCHDLTEDGYCGPDTRASMDSERLPEAPENNSLGVVALNIAIEELGNGEVGGNNSGPYIAKYKGILDDGDPDDDGAWCASFVSWCFKEASKRTGIPLSFNTSHGAKRLFRNVGESGNFINSPQPGDVVCWDRGVKGSWQGHIGFVEKLENGILCTVEGNVGRYPSVVRRFEHNMDLQTRLEGFARSS
ncbi:MAG: hypothetical protein CME70_06045 [Halobacteriovorax sp.]|nr:hypothetical protein [Halobacteriovorax sp.]|tara:strand:- start:2498 stop:3148 length:651 start_codon:yes stop_codon:yes gene_type:complete